MKRFKAYIEDETIVENFSHDQPLTRNQVRMALMKANVNPFVANSVARRLTAKELENPKDLALFMKQFDLTVEQTSSLIKYLSSLSSDKK